MAKVKSSHSNRGLDFEDIIKKKADAYKKDGRAYIYKIPTEFSIIRNGARIVSAFPKQKSICDFIGTLQCGQAITVEAKSVASSVTSFPFANIGDHQFEFFKVWEQCGGLGYYLIWFKEIDKCYLITSEKMQETKDTIGRKSIPLAWFSDIGNATEVIDFEFIEHIEKNYKKRVS
ncbi:Holliday junction resolvase RecU [Clostridium tagluense]|uniref:Holliday junction resolvase RecU n=1 Tax=Clostridium tagluense TaxID=360422 RepID=UPI000F61A6AF|nr:Holliday junction resolvase RecU [Clostridium tagluense]